MALNYRIKSSSGKFISKSNQPRHVRSFRSTDECFQYFQSIANSCNKSLADLFEQVYFDRLLDSYLDSHPMKLSKSQLSKRFNVSLKTLNNRIVPSKIDSFSKWSESKDPDGFSWRIIHDEGEIYFLSS